MKTILTIVVLIIAYGILRLVLWFVFGSVRVALKRRKIAKLDRLDRMDNGNRLRTYFLEMGATKQRILDRWPGQFPPGDEGKVVKQLASDCLIHLQATGTLGIGLTTASIGSIITTVNKADQKTLKFAPW